MQCPVDKNSFLHLISLAEGLPANQCSICNGVWISSNQYLAWLRTQKEPLPEMPLDDLTVPELRTNMLKLCPESGHILKRFKIFANRDFHLDRCGHCNGIWFDAEEWDMLAKHNMQDKANQFFTAPWQDKLREKESGARMEKIYLNKFGARDFERIQEIHGWLKDNPNRAMLIAFLQSDDPFEL